MSFIKDRAPRMRASPALCRLFSTLQSAYMYSGHTGEGSSSSKKSNNRPHSAKRCLSQSQLHSGILSCSSHDWYLYGRQLERTLPRSSSEAELCLQRCCSKVFTYERRIKDDLPDSSLPSLEQHKASDGVLGDSQFHIK